MYQLLSSPSEYPYHVDQGKKQLGSFCHLRYIGKEILIGMKKKTLWEQEPKTLVSSKQHQQVIINRLLKYLLHNYL